MRLALLRHGPTDWNVQGRIQGSIDRPLSPEGCAKMAAFALPPGIARARVFSSPMLRARQTAECLGLADPMIDTRLAEHDWGRWEGLTHDEILALDGAGAFAQAGRGLDFHPPGGESTRDLMARVRAFLRDAAKDRHDGVAVTHRGVLRTAYALATGWPMDTPMPAALDVSAILVLSLDADGAPAIAALNVPFIARTAPRATTSSTP